MKCEVVPSEVSQIISLSPSSPTCHTDVKNIFSFISKNGVWLYHVQDTVVNIYHAESGKCYGGHSFSESLNNPSARISAAVEFTSSHIPFPCLLLAVNQDQKSLLCMFDVTSCRVIRSVLIPGRITSMDVVSGNGGACVETHYLNRKLRFMFGIVAIGTFQGHLFFLDMCLDENFSCDADLPNITYVVRKHDFTAQRRELAISKKQHVFLHLNDESTSGRSFEFRSRNNTLGRFPNGEVYVTAMKYIQSLSTLVVGFNFGGIQLWDLHSLTLQYTISDHQDQSIVNFAFQEPENDPRNFCYLWIIKGHATAEEESPDTISVASLYSLTYHSRNYVDNFGALYTDLQSCNKRFEFLLRDDDSYDTFRVSPLIGSRLISCQVISQKDVVHHLLDPASSNESDSVSEDMSLCFLSWEAWPESENLPPSFHMAVFDLNQWYQAHMPFSFRASSCELNPYLGIFSVEEFGKNFLQNGVLSFYTVPQSVKKFKSLTTSEEFFYPSSLGFQLLCFTRNGLRKASYFGFQKHLLYKIADLGPHALLNPKEIYYSLLKSGLIPDIPGGNDRTSLSSQKEAILQLALEHNLPYFFMKCLKEWRYTDSMHEYCTSKEILNWAWKKVFTIKNSIDKICVPLFNYSGQDVDKTSLKYLYNFRRQLNMIDRIMAGYEKYVTPRTEPGMQELQCRRDAVSSINMYLQVILWLRSAHILPEHYYSEDSEEFVIYDFSTTHRRYLERRHSLDTRTCYVFPEEIILIDGLVEEIGIGPSWQEKGGHGFFPPPSIYAAVSCYLLDGISIHLKHSLMYYILLDIKHQNRNKNLLSELKKFPSVFGMSQSLVKQLKGFWYLDAQDTQNALQKLLHQSIKTSDILPWQHQRIIKSFLCYKSPESALKYINHMEPPQQTLEDMKLHLSTLLACGAITQAYMYQRKKQQEGYGNELLNHFFLGCQEMHKMKDLMYLPLNSLESSALVKFLSESGVPEAQESLVMYHLLHCNFFEATKVNEKFSAYLLDKGLLKQAPISKRAKHRCDLVTNLMTGIPNCEKCLFEEVKRFPSESLRIFDLTCAPLSLKLKKYAGTSPESITYSNIAWSMIITDSLGIERPDSPANPKLRNSYMEDRPFLHPPVTPEIVKPPPPMESSSGVAKRSLLATSPSEYSSPAKRSRLLDNVPFMSSPLSAKKTPKHLAGDLASLLRTPPIPKKISVSEQMHSVNLSAVRPQSILKNKAKLQHIQLKKFFTASTPSCSEAESSEEEPMIVDDLKMDKKDTENERKLTNVPVDITTSSNKSDLDDFPSRQIRFDLPVKEQNVRELSPYPDVLTSEQALQQSLLTELSDRGISVIPNIDTSSISYINEGKGVSDIHHSLTRKPLQRQEGGNEAVHRTSGTPVAPAEIIKKMEKSGSHVVKLSNLEVLEIPYPSTAEEKVNQNETICKDDISVTEVSTTNGQNSAMFRFTASISTDDGNTLKAKDSSQSFQKSSFVTPRPALRENGDQSSLRSQRKIDEGPVEEYQYSNTSTLSMPNKTRLSSLECTAPFHASGESVLSEPSDNDSFHSPCADIPLVSNPISCTEPLNLFPESNTEEPVLQQLQKLENVVPSFSNRDSEGSDETILLSSDTSNDAIDSEVSILHESYGKKKNIDTEPSMISESIIEQIPRKSSCINFVFSKAIPTSETGDTKDTQGISEHQIINSKSYDEAKNPSHSDADMDVLIEASDESVIKDAGVDSYQIPEISLWENISKPSRKTFVFTEKFRSSGVNYSESDLEISEVDTKEQKFDERIKDKSYPSKTQNLTVDTPDDSGVKDLGTESFKVPDISYMADVTKTSRKTFVFSRNTFSIGINYSKEEIESSEVQNNDQNSGEKIENLPHQDTAMDITEETLKNSKLVDNSKFEDNSKLKDSCSESFKVPDISLFEKPSRKSRKTFVFTKRVCSSGVNYTKDDLDCSELKNQGNVHSEIPLDLPQQTYSGNTISESVYSDEIIAPAPLANAPTNSDEAMESTAKSIGVIDIQTSSTETQSMFSVPESSAKPIEVIDIQTSSTETQSTFSMPESSAIPIKVFDSQTSSTETKSTFSVPENTVQKSVSSDNISADEVEISTNKPNEVAEAQETKKSTVKNNSTGFSKEATVRRENQFSSSEIKSAKNEQLPKESAPSMNIDFFNKMEDETYEEFANSLKQSAFVETAHKNNRNVLSSPTVDESSSSVSKSNEHSSKSKINSKKKKEKKSIAVGTTPGLSRRKKIKDKAPVEFSFAEPHSPADSEILKALAHSPETPLPSFIFSPPLTRGRLKKKILDETLGSSFSSMASDASFVKPHPPPPVDPILESINQEQSLDVKRRQRGRPPSHSKSDSKRKSSITKSKAHLQSRLSFSEKSFQQLTPIKEKSESTPSKKNSPPSPRNTSLRHSMILRQAKPKPDNLF